MSTRPRVRSTSDCGRTDRDLPICCWPATGPGTTSIAARWRPRCFRPSSARARSPAPTSPSTVRATSPDGMRDVAPPTVRQFDAVLVGFDVEGFSRTVEKAALSYGRAAGELAAQQILAGERIATDLARRAGLRFADALGDGAVYLRPQAGPTARDAR